MRVAFHRAAAGPLLLAAAGLLAGCGGGFSSAPASPPARTITSYAALGDGFTAAPYTGTTVGDDGCLRSDVDYPALVAEELHIDRVRDVSCTAATTASLTTQVKPPRKKTAVPPQLDAVDSDTDLVTIGAGIEDHDLLRHMFQICLALPCGDKFTPQTVLGDVNTVGASLAAAVRTIQDKAPEASIVLVGYPRIAPTSGTCKDLPEVDQLGLDAANQVLDAINSEVRSAARETGAEYLDVARLTAGHELCSGESWVHGSQGKRGDSIAYHPVAAEQRAVADALADLVRNP